MSEAVENAKLSTDMVEVGQEAFRELKVKLTQLSDGTINKAEYEAFAEKMNKGLEEYDKKHSELTNAIELEKKSRIDIETKLSDLEKATYQVRRSDAVLEHDGLGEKSMFFVGLLKKDLQVSESDAKQLAVYLTNTKYLRTDIGTDGGFLVEPEYANNIIKNNVEISEVRPIANVVSVSSKQYIIPKRIGEPVGSWIEEGGDIPETQAVYGQEIIANHALKVQTAISWEMTQDAEYNMAQQIAMDTSEEFNRIEGEAFVLGDSVGKPEGLLFNIEVQAFDSLTAGEITYKDMVDITGELKVFYLRRARWAMNTRTLARIRNIVDTVGQPLWQPTMAPANPGMILGYPYSLLQDFPNVATGNDPVMFGDFASAYTIVDRIGMTVMRDPNSLAGRGLIRFLFFKRVGGQIVKAEALKKIVII